MRRIEAGLLAVILGCSSSFCALAQEESVVVDLSVLEGLSSAPAVYAPATAEPLFPIVKKAPKVKKTPQPVAKKNKTAVKVEVKETKPIMVKEEPKDAVEEKVTIPQQIPFVESAEPVVVVDVEPSPEPKEAEKAEPQSSVDSALQAAPVVVENAPAPTEEAPKAEVTSPEAKAEVASPEPKVVEKSTEPQAPALLVEDTPAGVNLPSPQAVNNKLIFAEEVDELNDEQKSQIDGIIASFKDAKNNKIAIYAYNLEDGADAFKKKRLSLNRAVEVRSYLLPKGYKNFSIKVINVDAASGKGNTVEVEELEQ